jgi:hypothetical protein
MGLEKSQGFSAIEVLLGRASEGEIETDYQTFLLFNWFWIMCKQSHEVLTVSSVCCKQPEIAQSYPLIIPLSIPDGFLHAGWVWKIHSSHATAWDFSFSLLLLVRFQFILINGQQRFYPDYPCWILNCPLLWNTLQGDIPCSAEWNQWLTVQTFIELIRLPFYEGWSNEIAICVPAIHQVCHGPAIPH